MADRIADRISITVCGDGGCGKSSITLRLVRSEWVEDYDPTIEDSYSVTRTVDGLSYHLSLTDTAGQEEYRGLWASSNLQSDAFLMVYDITNPQTMHDLHWFLDMINVEADNRIEQNNQLLRQRGTRIKGRLDQGWKAPPVMIIAGNKCDLYQARAVASRTGWNFAKDHNCGFMETSARDMVNIEETFAWIVRKVVKVRKGEDTKPATKAAATPQAGSSQYQRRSGNEQRRSGNESRRSGNESRRSGNGSRRSGNDQRKSGSDQRRSGNDQRRSGNDQRRSGPDKRRSDQGRSMGQSSQSQSQSRSNRYSGKQSSTTQPSSKFAMEEPTYQQVEEVSWFKQVFCCASPRPVQKKRSRNMNVLS